MHRFPWLRQPWFWLALGLACVYARGLFLDLMDVDASQYASISMEMLQNGSWLEVMHRQRDYLDKPPLLFWTSAASFALFGLSSWAFKLPSLIAALAGVYAVFRFARLFYSDETARHAAFILAGSLGLILVTNDVRTDTLLLGTTACAVWQLAEFQRFGRWRNVLAAAVFAGLAMLAKGPIGLVAPAFALGTQILMTRDWRLLWRGQWLVGLAVVALVLAPMCWGLYQQFDLHPEKKVNGRTGVSGLWFYFWEQSFGRVTGENVWKNDASPFYFLHIYLWAFAPWALLLPGALWRRLREVWGQKFRLPAGDEAYSLGGFVLTFVALSASQYKLPHYIFITLPWAAVLTARFLAERPAGGWIVGFWATLAAAFVVIGIVLGFVFPTANPAVWGVPVAAGVFLAVKMYKNPFPAEPAALVQRGIIAMLAVGFVLNFYFYPKILPFQGTSAAAHFARSKGIPAEKMAFYRHHSHALDFYSGRLLLETRSPEQVRATRAAYGELWLYITAADKARLDEAEVRSEIAAEFGHFPPALLRPQFLDPATRPATLETIYLLKILPD